MFHVKHYDFDVAVIGGGHAGVEAALASARMGVNTVLISLTYEGIGVMSCNPAIGGLGKGHLVREIDALDGVMGWAADQAGIQFRLLNRRKGPAVQGPRAQADRKLYRQAIQAAVKKTKHLTTVIGEVVDFIMDGNQCCGVELADGTRLKTRSVILTTGTFLRGVIHIGREKSAGGRWGERPSLRLADRLDGFGLPLGRLKTGTPPRLDGRTIDWARLGEQPGDDEPTLFSFLSTSVVAKQISCGVTHTNAKTHDIIRNNLGRSAMYGGQIDGIGPRYCPSIEDKVVRFSDKDSHQVFLEPEGLDDYTVYPNGISTSLPVDVQSEYVQSMEGLESAEILQPGYAIEYDYVDPRALNDKLQVLDVPGLFLAGQINGTTGYEEAAAQGIVAGLNAALAALDRDPIGFDRSTSYIGVMIDDLVTRGVNEPYRMFTSRAEYRLSLRADNADQRLTPFGYALGCVGDSRWAAFSEKLEKIESAKQALSAESFTPSQLNGRGFTQKEDGKRRTALDLLSFPDIAFRDLYALDESFIAIEPEIQAQVSCDAIYAHYITRQSNDVAAMKRDEGFVIPEDFRFEDLSGLSNELKEKLKKVRPSSLGQAGRIEGMTPAALTLILASLRRSDRKKSA
jgi:tRNA uridine 5-carboxymethylaminomethyl modification enzyme